MGTHFWAVGGRCGLGLVLVGDSIFLVLHCSISDGTERLARFFSTDP
jgi:hypothetical protein